MSVSIVLAHITDAHVAMSGRSNVVLKDISAAILEDLVDQVVERGADLVLFGGDNIDNGSSGEEDLQAFLRIVAPIPRWVCVPGNHESRVGIAGSGRIGKDRFLEAVDGHGVGPGRTAFATTVGDVRVVGLDTTLTGSGGGHVGEPAMAFLAREIRDLQDQHQVVLGHHLLARPWAPYHLDVWDQEYLVENRQAVVALMASCPRARAYLCGHHHASRIDRIAGRGGTGGFYHVVSPSPAAFPHGARLITLDDTSMTVELLRPRLEGVIERGAESVTGGRKARRFSTLGSTWSFSEYVAGRTCDNDVNLPFSSGDARRRSWSSSTGARAG